MAAFQLSEGFFAIFNRRCLVVCIVTMIILILIDHIVNSSNKIEHQYCDARRIQEHYMNNLSAYELLKTNPVHSTRFEYEIVNKDFCGKDNGDIDLLIMVTSKSRSYERRNAIRRTYGNLNHVFKYLDDTLTRVEVRILFMINIDEYRIKSISFEQNVFNDIVQMKIPEEELMNTYRDISMMYWSSKYCPRARFLLKTDDTVFLNPFLLIKFINENADDRLNLEIKHPLDIHLNCPKLDARLPLLYGLIHSNENVQNEKYPITKTEYPCEIYPNYLNDHIYLISNDARDLILCTFYRQTNPSFPIPNIYLTGILPEYLHIERQALADYQINFDSQISCEKFFRNTNPFQAFACVITNELSNNVFQRYYIYWEIIINSQMENLGK